MAAQQRLKAVVTSISEPTHCMRAFVGEFLGLGIQLVVIGDRKSPERFDLPGASFVSLAEQRSMPFSLAKLLPEDHYARKNLGYLKVFFEGARCVYETDDDNTPNSHWQPRTQMVNVRTLSRDGWTNVYDLFTDEFVWPRGFPLNEIRRSRAALHSYRFETETVEAPIQQGLVDLAPDVDAFWRLLYDDPIRFSREESVWLAPGAWCPFNSQSTWWWSSAFPLMYLPSLCSFRVADIWRGLIAQRCLWETGHGLVFHPPEVEQYRNPHDLMEDFEAEIPAYLGNERFVETLADAALLSGKGNALRNLVGCYELLIQAGFLPPDEMPLVRGWVDDVERILAVN